MKNKIKKFINKINKINPNRIFIILISLLGIFLIINIFSITGLTKTIEEKIALAKEAARPAVIEIITIQDSSCRDCFDISSAINSIKNSNVNITDEKIINLNSNEANQLIEKYDIEKIPAILIFGEINKINIKGTEEKEDVLLFTEIDLPYTNAKTKQILGKVNSILIKEPSCKECTDLNILITQLKQLGVKIIEEKIVERNSDEGKELITKYKIDLLPTLVMSKDLSAYEKQLGNINENWDLIGTIENDGSYITRTIDPPYFDLITNKVNGLVKLTMLTDKSCDACYEVTINKLILDRFKVYVAEEETIDISESEGKNLIKKYSILKVPTIILSKDTEEYAAFNQAWQQVGTVENDGAYILRSVEVLGPYKDLIKNEIVIS